MHELDVIIPASAIGPHDESRRRVFFEVQRTAGIGINMRTVEVVLPGWNSGRSFNISARFIPEDLRSGVKTGEYFSARVNLGSSRSRGLRPTNFELEPQVSALGRLFEGIASLLGGLGFHPLRPRSGASPKGVPSNFF